MAGEGYPAGGGGGAGLTASQILLKLTGATVLAAGAMLFGAGSATLTTLAPGTNGHVLTLAGGVPTWAANAGAALPGSYTAGDLIYASGAATLAKLADVAVGNALLSGGVGVAPAWGKIALTTHVSGILPSANGGTGVANAGSLTLATSAAITGGGTLALGGFTLTVPATGTAALRGSLNTFTLAQTISDATASTSTATGALVVAGGLGVGGRVTAGLGLGVAGGSVVAGGIVKDATFGLNFWPLSAGATDDFSVFTPGGAYVFHVPTGTTTVKFEGTTAASSTTTGSLVNAGGFGNAGAAYIGGALTVAGASSLDQVSSSGTLNGDYLYKIANASGTGLGLRVQAGADGLNALAVRNAASAISFSVLGSGGVTGTRYTATQGTASGASDQNISGTATWNNAGITFTAWLLDVTSTASAAASRLLDLRVGGTPVFAVRKDGALPFNLIVDDGGIYASPFEVKNGAAVRFNVSQGGSLYHTVTTASTSAPVTSLSTFINCAGTPAAGFGAVWRVNMHSSTNTPADALYVTTEWATATHASRKARTTFAVYDTASRECLRLEASGSAAMIGFLGASASARVSFAAWSGTATRTTFDTATATLVNCAQAIKAIVDDLRTFGLYG